MEQITIQTMIYWIREEQRICKKGISFVACNKRKNYKSYKMNRNRIIQDRISKHG
jgi:hypothetical protein